MLTLYLASGSEGRQDLLKNSQISFKLTSHNFDEDSIKYKIPSLCELVEELAKQKLLSINLEMLQEKDCLLLTSDTMVQSATSKEIMGKPTNLADAKRMLKICREELIFVASGVALAKVENKKIANLEVWSTVSEVEFCVPESDVDRYLQNIHYALNICAAGEIDAHTFGGQFVKSIKGSYSNILGFDMFELRERLAKYRN